MGRRGSAEAVAAARAAPTVRADAAGVHGVVAAVGTVVAVGACAEAGAASGLRKRVPGDVLRQGQHLADVADLELRRNRLGVVHDRDDELRQVELELLAGVAHLEAEGGHDLFTCRLADEGEEIVVREQPGAEARLIEQCDGCLDAETSEGLVDRIIHIGDRVLDRHGVEVVRLASGETGSSGVRLPEHVGEGGRGREVVRGAGALLPRQQVLGEFRELRDQDRVGVLEKLFLLLASHRAGIGIVLQEVCEEGRMPLLADLLTKSAKSCGSRLVQLLESLGDQPLDEARDPEDARQLCAVDVHECLDVGIADLGHSARLERVTDELVREVELRENLKRRSRVRIRGRARRRRGRLRVQQRAHRLGRHGDLGLALLAEGVGELGIGDLGESRGSLVARRGDKLLLEDAVDDLFDGELELAREGCDGVLELLARGRGGGGTGDGRIVIAHGGAS